MVRLFRILLPIITPSKVVPSTLFLIHLPYALPMQLTSRLSILVQMFLPRITEEQSTTPKDSAKVMPL